MKRIALFTVALLACIAASAQDLWISGSAVPGGVQKLEKLSDNDYKYAGGLKSGELLVMTTKKAGKATRYLKPALPGAGVANRGIAYQESADVRDAAWQVTVGDDHYRFHISTDRKLLYGEIFQPWGELFIAGGATGTTWRKAEGHMLLMQQDLQNPYVWSWEGELKAHPDVEEPRSFKFMGQDRWSPKAVHAYQPDADILSDRKARVGGPDTKWTITKEGRYRIVVDLFNETVDAQLLK